ncbi:MAG: adenylate/guanylate cyclase domain-containing protein [Cyanobacteria bacterium P01_H01_bin.121]
MLKQFRQRLQQFTGRARTQAVATPAPLTPIVGSAAVRNATERNGNEHRLITRVLSGQNLLLVAFTIIGTAIAVTNPPWAERLELQALNRLLRWQAQQLQPPEEIIILGIDELSIREGRLYQRDPEKYSFFEPLAAGWPWQREAYAIAIEKLLAAGARGVAVDVILDQVSLSGPEDDAQLAAVLQRYPKAVTLASLYDVARLEQGVQQSLIRPHPTFQAESIHTGFINFPVSLDGYIHHLHQTPQPHIIPDLGLEQLPPFAIAALTGAALPIVSPRGEFFSYYGPQQTFKTLPFYSVLDPNRWSAPPINNGAFFRDKLVLIGPTAPLLQDIQATPLGLMPGVEVHANAIATLLEDRTLRLWPPLAWSRGALVAMVILLSGVVLRSMTQKPLWRAIAIVVCALIWWGITVLSFWNVAAILPIAIPIAFLLLAGFGQVTLTGVKDQLEKQRLRRTLERYIAAPIVEEILKQPNDYYALLAGRKLQAAVLFSDIRGFTTLTLQIPPEQLVRQLNLYFDRMVAAIVNNQGTLDKYIGDAVMAEFGSPVSRGAQADALNAVKAALEMRRWLYELRSEWRQTSEPLFFNGIGIHFGEVLTGNIGSQQRLEYAVIGDTVNTASRVETLSKALQTDIVITRSLYELVQDQVEVVPLGSHVLKGRAEHPIEVFGVISLKGESSSLYDHVHAEMRSLWDAP